MNAKINIDKQTWASPFSIALLTYYLVVAIIGMCIPDDILTNHAWAREFSDFMASIVPQIDRITALNIKPDLNRFYFSALWATSPILFLVSFCAFMDWLKLNYPTSIMPTKRILRMMMIQLIIIYISYNIPVVDDATFRHAHAIFYNPIVRGILGGATFVYATPLLGAGFIAITLKWIIRLFCKK